MRLTRAPHSHQGRQETENAQWKRAGRIVDGAKTLQEDGNFPPMPLWAKDDPDDQQAKLSQQQQQPPPGAAPAPYTVVPGMVTRGREPKPLPPATAPAPPAPPVLATVVATTNNGKRPLSLQAPPLTDGGPIPHDQREWKYARHVL